jgi:hypothetical protein
VIGRHPKRLMATVATYGQPRAAKGKTHLEETLLVTSPQQELQKSCKSGFRAQGDWTVILAPAVIEGSIEICLLPSRPPQCRAAVRQLQQLEDAILQSPQTLLNMQKMCEEIFTLSSYRHAKELLATNFIL